MFFSFCSSFPVCCISLQQGHLRKGTVTKTRGPNRQLNRVFPSTNAQEHGVDLDQAAMRQSSNGLKASAIRAAGPRDTHALSVARFFKIFVQTLLPFSSFFETLFRCPETCLCGSASKVPYLRPPAVTSWQTRFGSSNVPIKKVAHTAERTRLMFPNVS